MLFLSYIFITCKGYIPYSHIHFVESRSTLGKNADCDSVLGITPNTAVLMTSFRICTIKMYWQSLDDGCGVNDTLWSVKILHQLVTYAHLPHMHKTKGHNINVWKGDLYH